MKKAPSLSRQRQLRNKTGDSLEITGARASINYIVRVSGHLDTNTSSLGRKSLMDDFWLPKVSGALGTGKRGGKNPSQFQHVVSSTNLLFVIAFYLISIVSLYTNVPLYF